MTSPSSTIAEKKNMKPSRIIYVTDRNDNALLSIAEGALITGATLPSGFKVPDSLDSEGHWYVSKGSLVYYPSETPQHEPSRVIYATDQNDKVFLSMAKGACISESTLPSGFYVPQGDWYVSEDSSFLHLKQKN